MEQTETKEIKKSESYKIHSSYIVGFALKETYDDLITAQQMICNKRSPQESTNSISPTNSLKLLDHEHVIEIAEENENTSSISNISNENNEESGSNITLKAKETPSEDDRIIRFYDSATESESEVKVPPLKSSTMVDIPIIEEDIKSTTIDAGKEIPLIIDNQQNSVKVLAEEGLLEKNSIEPNLIEDSKDEQNQDICIQEEKLDNKPIVLADIVQDSMNIEDDKLTIESPKQDVYAEDQDVILNPVVTQSSTTIGDTLQVSENDEKESSNEMVNTFTPEIIYKKHSEFIQSKCNRQRIKRKKNMQNINFKYKTPRLSQKNQSRKLNLTSKVKNVYETTKFHETNDMSLLYNKLMYNPSRIASFPLIDKNSLTSDPPSLKQASVTSDYDDACSVETVNSVVEIASKNVVPYKTDIINVAVAVAYKKSKVNNEVNERVEDVSRLTSKPFIKCPPVMLVSTPATPLKTSQSSDATLVNKISYYQDSENDMFYMSQTSSEFNRSSFYSTNTLTDHDTELKTNSSIKNVKDSKNILDTVINLTSFHEVPSTSYSSSNKNEVVVTPCGNTTIDINIDHGAKKLYPQALAPSVLQKATDENNENVKNKVINIPNIVEIEALLKNNETPERKCAEEVRNPNSIPEMWEKFLIALNGAVKQIEETIPKKIISEISSNLINLGLTQITATKKQDVGVCGDFQNVTTTEKATVKVDESFQCSLINNTSIDRLMQKISIERPKILSAGPSKSFSKFKPKILEELIDVLKPLTDTPIVLGKDDIENVTISSTTSVSGNFFRTAKYMISVPFTFVKENMFVITSVAMFFGVSLCLYFLIFIIMTSM